MPLTQEDMMTTANAGLRMVQTIEQTKRMIQSLADIQRGKITDAINNVGRPDQCYVDIIDELIRLVDVVIPSIIDEQLLQRRDDIKLLDHWVEYYKVRYRRNLASRSYQQRQRKQQQIEAQPIPIQLSDEYDYEKLFNQALELGLLEDYKQRDENPTVGDLLQLLK